jgi:hypothetical protein
VTRYFIMLTITEVGCMTVGLAAGLLKAAVSAGWSWWSAVFLVPLSIAAALAYLFGIPLAVWWIAKIIGRTGADNTSAAFSIRILPSITLLTGIPLFVVLGQVIGRWFDG